MEGLLQTRRVLHCRRKAFEICFLSISDNRTKLLYLNECLNIGVTLKAALCVQYVKACPYSMQLCSAPLLRQTNAWVLQ